MLDQHQQDFEHLSTLYAKVKCLVLEGEAQDIEQKSNIAVFNEMRAALDHVFQCIGDDLAEEPEGKDFRKNQIRKAKEHLVRAAYDSLDGRGISFRRRISEMLKGLHTDSIAESFPEYYSNYIPKLNKLDEKIVESRKNRDLGGNSEENINKYEIIVKEMESIHIEIGCHLEYIANYNRLVSDDSEFVVDMKKFSLDAIYKICPQEYRDYINLTVELKEMLKQKIFKKEKDRYDELVKKISKTQNKMKNFFPDLSNFDKQNRKNGIKQVVIAGVIAVLAAIVGAVLSKIV
jgi:hypothetical protein